jgi:hypothetical protein
MAYHDQDATIRIGERDYLGFGFTGDDVAGSVVISSAAVTVSPATGLSLASAAAELTTAADGCYAWTTAVTAGLYYVTFTVTFSDGKVLKRIYLVTVPDPAQASTALVTMDDVRNFLGIAPGKKSEDTPLLTTIIEAVSTTFQNECSADLKPIASATYTLDGNGRSYLYLPNYPVTALTVLTEDDWTLTKDTDFSVDYDNGIIEKITSGMKWTTARQAIDVTCAVGYATLPTDIKLACLVEVARKYNLIKQGMFGESSRTLEGVSITVSTDELLPATLVTIERHERVKI